MAATTRRSSGPVLRSLTPSRNFHSSTSRTSSFSSPSSAFASSTSGFTSGSHTFLHRSSASPPRVNMCGTTNRSSSPVSSVRFSLDRSTSPSRSISVVNRNRVVDYNSSRKNLSGGQKRTCMCSPTTHPGSFRCALHKNTSSSGSSSSSSGGHTAPYNSNRLNMRRSAMTNSLVRIGTVEGDLVRRALAALIRPSSHQQRRREDFRHRSSRLSVMSKADE